MVPSEPGIYFDVSWDDYCAIDATSPSMQKHGLRSMLRLKRALAGECQPAMKNVAVGNAIHAMVAGGSEFDDRYTVMHDFENDEDNVTLKGVPTTSKATIYYKESVEMWQLENTGKDELTQVQVNTAKKVFTKIRNRWGELIDDSRREVCLIGIISGVRYKTRLDGLIAERGLVWDLKSTSNVDGTEFYRIFSRLNYGFSAAVHVELCRQHGIDVRDYRILAVEVGDDYDLRSFEVPIQVMENALPKVKQVAAEYRIAMVNNHWPGLDDGPLEVSNWDMSTWEAENELEWQS